MFPRMAEMTNKTLASTPAALLYAGVASGLVVLVMTKGVSGFPLVGDAETPQSLNSALYAKTPSHTTEVELMQLHARISLAREFSVFSSNRSPATQGGRHPLVG